METCRGTSLCLSYEWWQKARKAVRQYRHVRLSFITLTVENATPLQMQLEKFSYSLGKLVVLTMGNAAEFPENISVWKVHTCSPVLFNVCIATVRAFTKLGSQHEKRDLSGNEITGNRLESYTGLWCLKQSCFCCVWKPLSRALYF